MNTIEIKSSHRAQTRNYLIIIIWMAIAIFAIIKCNTALNRIADTYSEDTEISGENTLHNIFSSESEYLNPNVSSSSTEGPMRRVSWLKCFKMPRETMDFDSESSFFGGMAGLIVAISVLLVCMIEFINTIYATKTTTVISKGDNKITEKVWAFPCGFTETEKMFNRIIDVTVEQVGLNALLNNGSIGLKMLTYANATTVESEWTIKNIENPQKIKMDIMEGLPKHEGLTVHNT